MDIGNRHIEDEQLVELYRSGSEEALKLLIKRFHPKLIQSITYYTRSREPVEDLVQECWYAIIQKLDEINLHISFEAWALCIARRRAIDWIREQQRSRKYNEQFQAESQLHVDAPQGEESEEKLKMVNVGINRLPATQKMVLNMFYKENLNLDEIAEVLAISKGTVKSRLFYAREKLKEIISNQTEDNHE